MRGLSKSRFISGSQCHKRLWLETFEPDAPELVPDAELEVVFDRGTRIGELAREQFPGGVLVDLEPRDPMREPRTRELIAAGVPAIFEATFIADRTYAAIDVLLAEDGGFTLIEVKSTLRVKDVHIRDVALQTHVARRAGVDVRRVEVMTLNRAYVHPGPANLFLRTDVTERVVALLPTIPGAIAAQLNVLASPLPDIAIGPHCESPYTCPFKGRCWPPEPDGGLSRREDLVVESGLREALAPFRGRLGFLDFEAVGPAVPVWIGTSPFEAIAAQFSYHEGPVGGPYVHRAYLSEGRGDPRETLARRLLELTRGAEKVVMYSSAERKCIRGLARAVPALAADLDALAAKLVDLWPVVKRYIHHPDFEGKTGIKTVLPALVQGMSHADLVRIADGHEAGVKLERYLLDASLSETERVALRGELLEYCQLDTLAMVKLLERLWELAA